MAKMTKKEMFNEIIALATEQAHTAEIADIVEFCEHEIELLNKKRGSGSRKPSKETAENAVLRERMYLFVAENGGATVTDLETEFGVNTHRVAGLMSALVKEGRIEKEKVKGKVRYVAVADCTIEVDDDLDGIDLLDSIDLDDEI